MEEECVSHDFQEILLSIINSTCPVAFDSVAYTFQGSNGRYCMMKISNGKATRTFSDTPMSSEEQSYDKIVEIHDRAITGDVDELISSKMMAISDFIAEKISEYFLSLVIRVNLVFGIVEQCLILLDTSTVETSPTDDNLFAADEMFETRSEISTQEAQTDLKCEIHRVILKELENFSKSKSVCCTRAPECGPPRYKIKKVAVLMFNLVNRFPDCDEQMLLKMVKNRMKDSSVDAVCCVQCYHCYLASYRVCKSTKRATISFDMKPQPFQAFVLNETSKRGKNPISSTVNASKEPQSYVLNIVNSPYQQPCFKRATLLPPPRLNRRSPNAQPPGWVLRLSGDAEYTLRATTKSRCSTRASSSSKWSKFTPSLPAAPIATYEPSRPMSQQLASRSYKNSPFDVGILDPKRRLKGKKKASPFE